MPGISDGNWRWSRDGSLDPSSSTATTPSDGPSVGRSCGSATARSRPAPLPARSRGPCGRSSRHGSSRSSRDCPAYGLAFRTISELAVNYRRSPAVAEGESSPRGGPRAGDRLPDARVTKNDRGSWLHEALDAPTYHLLLCGPTASWDDDEVERFTDRWSKVVTGPPTDEGPRNRRTSRRAGRCVAEAGCWRGSPISRQTALLHWLPSRVMGQTRAHEISPMPSPPPSAKVGLRRVPVPARGHHPGGAVVPAVRPVLPGRRGAPRRARHRGRPREHLPVGPAVRARVRGGRSGPSARHRGSLARR